MLKKYLINKSNNLYYLKKEDIENETESVLEKYSSLVNKDYLYNACPIPIEEIIEFLGLRIDYKTLDKGIIGAFVFNKGKIKTFDYEKVEEISIDAKHIIINSYYVKKDDKRIKFTLGHELGHYYLQYPLFHIDENQLSIFDYGVDANGLNLDDAITFDRKIEYKEIINQNGGFKEWQANYFSAAILIPKKSIEIKLNPLMQNYNRINSKLLLDTYSQNIKEKIVNKLSKIYDVSNQMMQVRLVSLGYMKEVYYK